MIRPNVFVGIEAEGPDRGELTVFFPRGAVTKRTLPLLYDKVQKLGINRLYFGAGNRRGLSQWDIELICALGKGKTVLAEVRIKDLEVLDQMAIPHVQLILVLQVKKMMFAFKYLSHIKFVGKDKLIWYPQTQIPSETFMDDTFYKTDTKVKL